MIISYLRSFPYFIKRSFRKIKPIAEIPKELLQEHSGKENERNDLNFKEKKKKEETTVQIPKRKGRLDIWV
tara:strand:+ start:17305 stop:17517 length:213 start_codon:yes stop_codon:yes gene_type:complete